ncbi:MAG: hypothetical protein IT581_21920 [Verrucomicrobiales bacterium]|nr:hypothetical protein [Verrucomicrobiales bacterium]
MPTSKKAANVEVRAAAAPEAPVGQDVTSVVATGARTSEVRGRKAQAQARVKVKAKAEERVEAGVFREGTTADAGVAANAAVAPGIAGDVVSTDRVASRSRKCRRVSRST